MKGIKTLTIRPTHEEPTCAWCARCGARLWAKNSIALKVINANAGRRLLCDACHREQQRVVDGLELGY